MHFTDVFFLNGNQDGRTAANASMVGGETEALNRLKKFAAECQAQPPKGPNGSNDSIYGANFSCKISPWLTMGCISPRSMFDELKKTATRCVPEIILSLDPFLFNDVANIFSIACAYECSNLIDRIISAASNRNEGGSGSPDTGMRWLMYELLWRDFFR